MPPLTAISQHPGAMGANSLISLMHGESVSAISVCTFPKQPEISQGSIPNTGLFCHNTLHAPLGKPKLQESNHPEHCLALMGNSAPNQVSHL